MLIKCFWLICSVVVAIYFDLAESSMLVAVCYLSQWRQIGWRCTRAEYDYRWFSNRLLLAEKVSCWKLAGPECNDYQLFFSRLNFNSTRTRYEATFNSCTLLTIGSLVFCVVYVCCWWVVCYKITSKNNVVVGWIRVLWIFFPTLQHSLLQISYPMYVYLLTFDYCRDYMLPIL